MNISKRQSEILKILETNIYVSVNELSKLTYTSPSSIRRDLSHLEDLGLVNRSYGGVALPEMSGRVAGFYNRTTKNIKEKRIIAQKASSLLCEGQSILLDSSTTASFMVPHIARLHSTVVFTNNLETAINAINHGIQTRSIGGGSINGSVSLGGPATYKSLLDISVDIMFFSSQSLSIDGLITDSTEEENYVRQKDEHGVYRYPNGQRWVDPKNLNIVKHPKPRLLFKHTSENQIAVMLRLDPARMAPFLIGRRIPYGERFVKDFVDSLNDTVVIDKNDTPEEAELRKAVLETKAELKAAMDRGEDIAKIMNDTQKELDRLCQYHNDLKKLVKEAVDNPEFSDKDVEDYVTAANEMLKKQGLNGLTMPKLVNRQARLLMMSERKKALEVRKQGN